MRLASANMLLGGLVAVLACGKDDPSGPVISDIQITRFTVLLGDTAHLSAAITDEDGNAVAGTPVWSSLDPDIVEVTPGGVAGGIEPGVARVIAQIGEHADTALVGTALAFPKISAGYYHACGLTAGGEAWCWGDNYWGQLGIGTDDGAAHPVARRVSTTQRFKAIATGDLHTCALTLEGEAWCWGGNFISQLGDGARDDDVHGVPVRTAGTNIFADLDAGAYFTCGRTDLGETWCWGYNAKGQTGSSLGTSTCTLGDLPYACVRSPTRATSIPLFTRISVGADHSCGVTSTAQAWCWGRDSTGQLGRGVHDVNPHPAGSQVTGPVAFATVSAGFQHTCGISTTGTAYCWGGNDDGELGRGTFAAVAHSTPVAVSGNIAFANLSVGFWQSCGFTASGETYCWGWGDDGQLGHDPAEVCGVDRCTTSPRRISGDIALTAIESAAFAVCGVGERNGIYCWGFNEQGILGDGSTVSRYQPRLASSGGAVAAAARLARGDTEQRRARSEFRLPAGRR